MRNSRTKEQVGVSCIVCEYLCVLELVQVGIYICLIAVDHLLHILLFSTWFLFKQIKNFGKSIITTKAKIDLKLFVVDGVFVKFNLRDKNERELFWILNRTALWLECSPLSFDNIH